MTMGEGITKMPGTEVVDMMVADDFKLPSYTLGGGTGVSQPPDDVAIIGYKAHMEYEREGRPGKQDAYYASSWLRDGGSWKCGAGNESRIIACPQRRDREEARRRLRRAPRGPRAKTPLPE